MAWHAGMLDQRVSLKHRSITDDQAGGGAVTYEEYVEVWAHVRPMSGREREHAQRAESSANYLIVVRNRDDVLDGDRATWRGRDLNVRFVKRAGPRSAWLEIEAEMGAAS